MTTAVTSEATNRPSTISGLFGNATQVEASTIGLMAGADSRNASAAAGATPRVISDPATGTDAHSQPGSDHPARTRPPARPARRASGSAFCQNDAGTKAAIAPDSTTPRTRNGRACTMIETKIVAPACSAGESKRPTSHR